MSVVRAGSLIFRNAVSSSSITRLRDRLETVQNKAVTGLEIEGPSDDPSAWPFVQGLQDSLADQQMLADNAERAQALLGVADNVLGETTNVLSEATALAVRFANDTSSQEDRDNAALEVAGFRDSLLSLANTDVGGRHIFAGQAYDAHAFDDAGNYQGAGAEPSIAVGPGNDTLRTGFDGSAVFDGALSALADLESRLQTGTAVDVQQSVEDMRVEVDKMIHVRTEAGVDYAKAVDVIDVSESLRLTLNESLSNEVSADPFATFQEFTELSNHLEATLQLTASSNSMRGLFERF